MAQSDDLSQAASRLEAALERIANAVARPRPAGTAANDAAASEVATRLDGLISQLRRALAGAPN
jgi:hypothetical protein